MESKVAYDIFHLIYWDWRIALDLFLGGLGVGAFIYAISVMFYRKDDELVSVRVGTALGPIAMTAGLLFMLSEMGQPLRIYKTLIRFNPTSTLAWGGIIQEGFVLFSATFAFLLFTNKSKNLRQGFAVFAGFFALFAAFYHGFLLSFVTARPLWNAGAVNVASVISSITTGIAAVLLLASFSTRGKAEIGQMNPALKNVLLMLLIAQISTCLIWLVTLMTGKADFVNAYIILNQDFGLLLWLGAILIGLIVPFLVLSAYSFGAKRDNPIPIPLISIPILIGGLVFRYVLVIAGQIS